MNFGNAVATANGESLTEVDLGKIDLGSYVIDHRSGDVELGAALDSLQARRRVDLHHLRPVFAFEHVDAGKAETHDLGQCE